MIEPPRPLRIPEPLKRLARKVRDNRAANGIITTLARPIAKALPERARGFIKGHAPRMGLATARLPNGRMLKLYAPMEESVVNEVFYGDWTGCEPETLPLWVRYAAEAEVVVDVGAHIGHFSVVAGLINPKAKIIAFECLPRVIELLRHNVKLNGVNVDIRQKAMGRKSGTAPFYAVPYGIPSSSSLDKQFMIDSGVEIEMIDVGVSTLDLEKIPKGVTLLKMDTETTEPDVVAGAHKLLKRKPVIFVEVFNDGARLRQELARAGYEYDAYLLTHDGPVRKPDIEPYEPWLPNYLLLPAGTPMRREP